MPVVFYLVVGRIFRAFKVLFLLVRRRDLAGELPVGYFNELARSNRWVQLQLVGIPATVVWIFSTTLPAPFNEVLPFAFLVALPALFANFMRAVVARFR